MLGISALQYDFAIRLFCSGEKKNILLIYCTFTYKRPRVCSWIWVVDHKAAFIEAKNSEYIDMLSINLCSNEWHFSAAVSCIQHKF